MKLKILFLFFSALVAAPFSGFAQTPGNMDDVQWSELAKSATSVSLTEIQQNPEKFNGQKVIVFGRIGDVQIGDRKTFVVKQLYQPKYKDFNLEDLQGAMQRGPSMYVYFDTWYTNCAATAAGRDRIRSLSTKGETYLMFNQERFALVAVVRLFSDTFQPYLSLIEFHAAESEAKSTDPSLPTQRPVVAPSLPSQLPPQRTTLAEAMHAEQERVNGFDDSIKRQLRDLFLDAQAKQKDHRWAETAANCEKVLSIDPENHYALSMLGNAYARLDKFELAEKHLSKAIQLMPADYSTYLAMFLVYARKGETNAAVAALETAVKNGAPTTYELRKDTDVPDNFKHLPKFKELTAVSLDKLTANTRDADLFENRTKDLQMNYDAAWNAVEKALKDQRETLRWSDKENGLLITESTAHFGLGGNSYDQYFIVLERSGDVTSKLSFKLFRYYADKDGSLKPENKPFIENRAKKFLDNVNKAATKKK